MLLRFRRALVLKHPAPASRTRRHARLKIRVHTSDLYIAMVNALGANAVPVSFDEMYQALAQGVIDGAENNWPSFFSARTGRSFRAIGQ